MSEHGIAMRCRHTVSVTLKNDGDGDVDENLCSRSLERLASQSWEEVQRFPEPPNVCTMSLRILSPGRERSRGGDHSSLRGGGSVSPHLFRITSRSSHDERIRGRISLVEARARERSGQRALSPSCAHHRITTVPTISASSRGIENAANSGLSDRSSIARRVRCPTAFTT